MAKKKEKRIEDYPLELENDDYNLLEQMEDISFAKLMRAWWEFFRGNDYEKYLSPDNQFQFEYLTFRTNKRRNIHFEDDKKASNNGRDAVNRRWDEFRKRKEKEKQKQVEQAIPFAEAEVEEVEKYPFEDFYEAFGNKKKPKEARKAWAKLKEEEKALAMEKVSQYVAHIRYKAEKEHWETKTEFQMLPSSYINGKCWEGEYEIPTETNNQNASNYGSNNGKYNSRLEQQQRNNEVLCNIMEEAAAAVQPINPTESGI